MGGTVRRILALGGAWWLLAWVGLHSQTPPSPATGPEKGTASVKPGINAEFLKPDLNPAPWVERFEKEGREVYDQRHRIVAAVGLKPGSVVADVGAGTGLFTFLFADEVQPGGRVYAVDISPALLGHLRRRASERKDDSVVVVQGGERDARLPGESVDRVFICDTYHHFEYPAPMLASIHRALRPGGELVLVEFKRVPGESSEWVLNHVRAGQDVFESEIRAAGFERVDEPVSLKENYVVRFRKRTK